MQRQLAAREREQGLSTREARERLLAEKQAICEFTTPEQIAGLVLFPCSSAATTITGAALSMDGGWMYQ